MEGESAVEALQNMFLDTESSDISILCGNNMQEIPCHKLILSSRSDVFKAMFKQTEMKEMKDGILKIEDISTITLTKFLKYMYTDSLDDVSQIGKKKETYKKTFECLTVRFKIKTFLFWLRIALCSK